MRLLSSGLISASRVVCLLVMVDNACDVGLELRSFNTFVLTKRNSSFVQ